jgi:hypothetical protein
MRRTCERPGCAEPASVAFGMVPEDLLVWLEACDPSTLGENRPGLLCRRHADKLVVPVGWTLDDHREAVPRLFKVRDVPAEPRPSSDHTGRMRRPKMQQASLLDLVAQEMLEGVSEPAETETEVPTEVAGAEPEPVPAVTAGDPAGDAHASDDDHAEEPSWRPTFDRSDDLGGLLAPRGKLLRRAFGAEPPR